MDRISVRTAALRLGLGLALLPVGALADPVAPFVEPPFADECDAIHHFDEGVAPPIDGCSVDPLCVEYEKRDITAANGGAVDFLAAEPARFAIAIPKCRYWQQDHWRVQVSPGDPTIVGWDGSYWFDKRNATGGAEFNNFTIGGQTGSPGQVADLVEPTDPNLAAAIRSYGSGSGGGGGSSFNLGIDPDPACGAPEACGDDPAVSRTRAAVAAQCACASALRPGLYRKCVSFVVDGEIAAGRMPAECRSDLLRCVRRSTCGRGPTAVTCYRTDRRGRTKCTIRHNRGECRPPEQGSAVEGTTPSCCDPRTVDGCS